LSERLKNRILPEQVTIMEVCGTHTMAIHRAGLHTVLPGNLRLLSGPGCPVCVTSSAFIDTALEMARRHGVMLATFGDMMRVPGNTGSLSGLRREGYSVEIVYSPLDALRIAREQPDKSVVFLAVGFETTVPAVAEAVNQARISDIGNFFILTAHKRIVPALELLVHDRKAAVDGFILPGHVSIVLGSEPYRFLAEQYNRACVITGFETSDIIQGILMLIDQIETGSFEIEIQYTRVVKPDGNPIARSVIDRIFETIDTEWRGFGAIPSSGLGLREEYADYDAYKRFPVTVDSDTDDASGCRCGEVLRGYIIPPECGLFGSACIPDHPVGPCMVSGEGTCAAYYRYSHRRK